MVKRGTATQTSGLYGAYQPVKQVGIGLPGSLPSGQGVTNPPTGSGGPPVDPALEAQKAQASNALRLGDVWDTYSTGRIGLDYGFNAQGGIDPNNPYSRASLLQRAYENSRRGTTNSYAAQGQLYSGAANRAQDTNARNYDIGLDQLRKSQAGALDQILKGKLDRYSTYGAGLDDAQLNSILKALGG